MQVFYVTSHLASKVMELAEETELKLKAEIRQLRDRLAEAQADIRIWRANYQQAITVASIFVAPALLESLEDVAYRRFEESVRR